MIGKLIERFRDGLPGAINLPLVELTTAVVVASIVVIASRGIPDPVEPLILSAQATYINLCFILVFAVSIRAAWGPGSSASKLGVMVSNIIGVVTWGAMGTMLLSLFGDETYRFALNSPDTAASIVVAGVFFLFTVRFACGVGSLLFRVKLAAVDPAIYTGQLTAITPRKPTDRDHKYTAAHEAGHALLSAAFLDNLTDDFCIAINEKMGGAGQLGFVRHAFPAHLNHERSFVEWLLLMLLAGQGGERWAYGQATMGSHDDLSRWMGVAQDYLLNDPEVVFYSEPKGKDYLDHNTAELEKLRKSQLEKLDAFFELNQELFRELREALLVKRTLDAVEAAPYLRRVQWPDNFPMPEKLGTDPTASF